jgi:GTPase SAR1 family protein
MNRSYIRYEKDVARQHPHIPELNVLVVGMPNVGKSTLLNVLRDFGIPGRMLRLIFFTRHVFTAIAYLRSNAQGPPHFRAAGADEGTFYTAETIGRPTCVFL